VHLARGVLIGLALMCLAGCGGDRFTNRVEVSGQVKHAGQPLAAGTIVFTPKSGSTGPGAEAQIVNGQYKIEKTSGPTPGPYRVLIATQHAAGNLMPKASPKGKGKTKAKINPPSGPGPWRLEVEVPEGETFTKDFEVK